VPIVEPHYHAICRVFWDRYIAHPATAHIRSYYTPKRIESLATKQLHLVTPSRDEAIVIERVVPAEPPAASVVARR